MSHRPRKRFGQNFLRDMDVIARILAHLAPQPGETLVEIGPGQGALTTHLLRAVGRLEAVELDRDLIEPLRARCASLGELRLHQADALRFDFTTLAAPGQRLRVVGNLPYNISTPLLFHLLDQAPCIQDMHFMLQREVVERLAAAPGGKDHGRLSLMVQLRCQVTPLFQIEPAAFYPAPKVHSSFVRLVPHAQPPHVLQDQARFAQLVTQAFSQRRKTLGNALRGWLPASAIAACGIDPGLRPEQLGLADFARLANLPAADPTPSPLTDTDPA